MCLSAANLMRTPTRDHGHTRYTSLSSEITVLMILKMEGLFAGMGKSSKLNLLPLNFVSKPDSKNVGVSWIYCFNSYYTDSLGIFPTPPQCCK